MKKSKETLEFTGRVSEGTNHMVMSTDEGIYVEFADKIDAIVLPYNHKRSKVTITIEIEELFTF